MIDYRYESYKEEHPRSYLMLLSLLLHGSIILLFLLIEVKEEAPVRFFNQPEEQSNTIASPPQQLTQPMGSQAELVARSSNFGAPVIFSDDLQLPTNKPEAENPVVNDASEIAEKEIEQKQPEQSILPTLAEKIEVAPSQEILLNQAQEAEPVKKPMTRRKRKKVTTDTSAHSAGPIKKQLTFADIAAGFLQTIHRDRNEGNALVSRMGDPNIKPTEIDLKYNSYMAKFHWYVENSSRLHPLRPEPPFTNSMFAKILVTLDKEGNVKNIQIAQPSGRPDLDNHIAKIIKKAAPFPELPDHFGTNVFTIPLSFNVVVYPGSQNGEYIFASQ